VSAVGSAASVAADEYFVAGEQGLPEQIGGPRYHILQLEDGANSRDGVIKGCPDGHMAGTFFGEHVDFKLENSAEPLTM
jgi:hypothetical protein